MFANDTDTMKQLQSRCSTILDIELNTQLELAHARAAAATTLRKYCEQNAPGETSTPRVRLLIQFVSRRMPILDHFLRSMMRTHSIPKTNANPAIDTNKATQPQPPQSTKPSTPTKTAGASAGDAEQRKTTTRRSMAGVGVPAVPGGPSLLHPPPLR